MTLTPASLELFKALAEDAPNWSGTPPCWVTKEERGNLTQLKRAKLLATFVDEGDSFAFFTQAGVALAAAHGIDLSWAPTVDEPVCAWFRNCTNAAVTTVPHPVLGDVPCCQSCADFARS